MSNPHHIDKSCHFASARCGFRMWTNDSGSIQIETALGFMMIMTLMLGIIEVCMMGYTYSVLEDATREGVRYAAIHGTDSTACSGPGTGSGSACSDASGANISNYVTVFTQQFCGNLSGMDVSVTYPDGTSTPASQVQVMITYTYQPLFKLPGTRHTLQVSSEGRIMY
jgi:Flp pilus assembly protein TadG